MIICCFFWPGVVVLCHLGFIRCVASVFGIGLGWATGLLPKWTRCNRVEFFLSTFCLCGFWYLDWLCRCVDLLICLVVLILCEMFLFVLRYSMCLGCFVLIFLCCMFVLCLFIGVLYDLCSVLSGW